MIDQLTYILDAHGKPVPCDTLTWALWFESADRIVKVTHVDHDTVSVSTIFLGLDQSFGWPRGMPPVLWETMVIGGPHDGYQMRYTSRAAALRHHAALVRALRAQPSDEDAEPVPLPDPHPRRRITLGD